MNHEITIKKIISYMRLEYIDYNNKIIMMQNAFITNTYTFIVTSVRHYNYTE